MTQKKIGNRTISLVRGDITDLDVQAFVYDITEDAQIGTGYGGAIAQRGGPSVQQELEAIGSCPTGEAVVTSAGSMKAKHIIHVNGPKFHYPDTPDKLRRATRAALQRAEETGITQLAFPPVGTGLYQVPLDLCAEVMVGTVEEHLSGDGRLEEVLFVALDTREFEPLQAQIEGGA